MRRLLRNLDLLQWLRRHRAAGAVEYALLVGLIAVGAMGAIAVTGDRVQELFGAVENRVGIPLAGDPVGENPGGPGGPGEAGSAPVVAGSFDPSSIGYGALSSFSWSSDNADSLSATARYIGSCPASIDPGTAARDLGWSARNGTDSFPWDTNLAGCSEEVCVEAANADGASQACATLAYDAWDNAPAAFDFTDIADAAPSSLVETLEAATLSGFDGAIPVSIDNAENGAQYSIDGGTWTSSGGTISAGQTLALRVEANSGFGIEDGDAPENASRTVTVTAGAASADWAVENAAQDTTVAAFSFGPEVGVSPNSTATSNGGVPVVLEGFTGTLDLTLTTSTVPADEGGATIIIDGVTTQHVFDETGKIVVPVTSGTEVTLWLIAPATIADTRQIQASIGDPVTVASWEVAAAENKLVLSTPTNGTSWTVPAGVTSIQVKAWGAGGGSGDSAYHGAGGGAVTATISVTPGEQLSIYVAGGGDGGGNGSTSAVGGTGYRSGGASVHAYGSGGGGASAILSGSDVLVVAAGGGGGGWGAIGGAGGGNTGASGGFYRAAGGTGATQTAHGTGAAGNNGSDAGGGDGLQFAGGGGGGWFSGGGGLGDFSRGGGGGGGGSSYINPSFATGQNFAGSAATPGNSGDDDLIPGHASAILSANTNGGDGLVVITW